jgi:hypothetical protein
MTVIRNDLLKVLTALSETCPEMRFGQLIANLATLARGPAVEAIWDAEDDELLAAAQEQMKVFLARPARTA